MRFRLLSLFVTGGLGVFVVFPLAAQAAGIPYFGPIVPTLNQTCAGNWDGLITLVNNTIAALITYAIVLLAPLMLGYAGFLYVVNPVNPSGRSQANQVLMNTIIGIVVMLSAWLIVNGLLTALTTKGGIVAWTTGMFGDGSQPCLPQAGAVANTGTPGTPGSPLANCPQGLTCTSSGQCLPSGQTCNGGTVTCADGQVCGQDQKTCVSPAGSPCGSTTCKPNYTCNTSTNTCVPPLTCTPAGTIPLNATGTGPCDPNVVQSYASTAGYSLTVGQAETLACIASPESSCGQKNPPYNLNYGWNKPNPPSGYGSTAAGAFQVLLSTHSDCYDNAICEAAGGTPGTPLNCKSGFTNGFEKTDAVSQATIARCKQAAGTVTCSVAAVSCLLTQQSFMTAYKADKDANSCKTQYNGGNDFKI